MFGLGADVCACLRNSPPGPSVLCWNEDLIGRWSLARVSAAALSGPKGLNQSFELVVWGCWVRMLAWGSRRLGMILSTCISCFFFFFGKEKIFFLVKEKNARCGCFLPLMHWLAPWVGGVWFPSLRLFAWWLSRVLWSSQGDSWMRDCW